MTGIDANKIKGAVQALKDAQAQLAAGQERLVTYEGQLKKRGDELDARETSFKKGLADYPTELFGALSPVYPGVPQPASGEGPTAYLGRVGEMFAGAGKDLTVREQAVAKGEADYKQRLVVLEAREAQVSAAFKELEGVEGTETAPKA